MSETSQSHSKPARWPHVVVVEDEAILAMALEDALLRAGAARVTVCSAMSDALEVLERTRADALVLDVHLADRDDGWALAELAAVLGARRPSIAFSTGTPEAIPEEVRAMGPVYAKPYDCDVLADEMIASLSPGLVDRLREVLR